MVHGKGRVHSHMTIILVNKCNFGNVTRKRRRQKRSLLLLLFLFIHIGIMGPWANINVLRSYVIGILQLNVD